MTTHDEDDLGIFPPPDPNGSILATIDFGEDW